MQDAVKVWIGLMLFNLSCCFYIYSSLSYNCSYISHDWCITDAFFHCFFHVCIFWEEEVLSLTPKAFLSLHIQLENMKDDIDISTLCCQPNWIGSYPHLHQKQKQISHLTFKVGSLAPQSSSPIFPKSNYIDVHLWQILKLK